MLLCHVSIGFGYFPIALLYCQSFAGVSATVGRLISAEFEICGLLGMVIDF